MKINKAILLTALCAVFTSVHADNFVPPSAQTAPEVDYLVRWDAIHRTQYNFIYPQLTSLTTLLQNTVDQATYANLDLAAVALSQTMNNGRVVITLPDGTVVVDTSKGNNTFANFQAKAINENHNSRVSIFDAQAWVGGVGAERKFSSTTQTIETYTAVRLGAYLNSVGTVRLSSH